MALRVQRRGRAVFGRNLHCFAEETSVNDRPKKHHAGEHRRHRQRDQRPGHHAGRIAQLAAKFRRDANFSVKSHEQHAERIKSGYEHAKQNRGVCVGRARQFAMADGDDDRVLGKEAGERRNAGERERTDRAGDVGDRQHGAQSAHSAHVLLVMHGDDHRAGREKQQRLEEGVRAEVKDRDMVGRGAERDAHVAELRQRGIRDHALDVILHKPDQSHEQRGGRADDQHRRKRGLRKFKQRRHARHHVDAGGNHGGRMNQRRDRRRPLHGIRQPHMQRHLRGFSHRADEQQQADQRHPFPFAERRGHGLFAHPLGAGEHRGVIQRAEQQKHRGDAEQEAEIADAVDQERLEVGGDRAVALIPKTDEQIRHQPDRLPAEKQLQEVVRHHQHQHGEGEQRDVAKEALVAGVAGHVADGVDVHHQRNESHHDHHGRAQRVYHETDAHRHAAAHAPGVDGVKHAAGRAGRAHIRINQQRQRERRGDRGDGDAVRAAAADAPPEQADDQRRRQAAKRNGGID